MGYPFISTVMNRAEAWTIEQHLLSESMNAKPDSLPENLESWGGRSELRLKESIPESWYLSRFWELLEQLHEVGWEELAEQL